MTKLLIVVNIFLVIILMGCGKRYNYDVYLSPTNFNEHFNLDIEFVEEDEKTSLVVHLLPRFGLSIIDINIEVKLFYDCLRFKYIEWVPESFKETIKFDNKKSDTHRKVIEIGSIDKFKDFKLREFNLFECSGKISTYETPEHITKGFVTNKKKNLVNYNEMNESLKKLDTLYESNYLNIKMTTITKLLLKSGNGQYECETALTNLRADPFYSEIDILSSKSIIKQENDNYYSYIVLGSNNDITYVSKNLIPIEDVDKSVNIASIFDTLDLDISVDFKPDLNLVQKLDNGYKVTGFYKDLFDDKDFQDVLDIYDELEYDAEEILSNALFEMIITVNQESIYMDITVDIFINEELYLASSNIIMEITFEEFDEVDYTNNENYYILPNNNLENANYVTDFTKKINGYYTDDVHVYYTELEKGYYLLNDFGYNYDVYIYDKDKILQGISLD